MRKFRENETFRCMIQPATSEVLNCDHPLKGNWGRVFFGNGRPIVVELGCGKGDYTIDLAERNPSTISESISRVRVSGREPSMLRNID